VNGGEMKTDQQEQYYQDLRERLMKFYSASSDEDLIESMVHHIDRLQARLLELQPSEIVAVRHVREG
jgi:hypothetical protein